LAIYLSAIQGRKNTVLHKGFRERLFLRRFCAKLKNKWRVKLGWRFFFEEKGWFVLENGMF
jgi:hypothetical protein